MRGRDPGLHHQDQVRQVACDQVRGQEADKQETHTGDKVCQGAQGGVCSRGLHHERGKFGSDFK